MNVLQRTAVFADWLEQLADVKAKARITARLAAAAMDHFGDCASVGEGVSEMRIDFGPGYRVYFMREGALVYLLLCGGDKSSQRSDIKRARELARRVRAQRSQTLVPDKSFRAPRKTRKG